MKRMVTAASLTAALLVPAVPAFADGPIVRTEECPPGRVGRTIHVGDNISVYNCYPLP